MAEYIEREALMERLTKKKAGVADRRYTEGFNDALMRFRSMLHSAPTADVVEVRHGEWVKDKVYHCSVCAFAIGVKTNYCPNCGTKMDGKGEGE